MEMVHAVAVANWKDEQLEISKWFKKIDEKKMYKELEQILVQVFQKFVHQHTDKKDNKNIRNAELCFGTSSDSLNSSKVPSNITKKVHYIFAKGHYMDPKKRSYFMPENIIIEGDIDIDKL